MGKYIQVLRDRYASLVSDKEARDRGEDPRNFIRTGFKDFDAKAAIERSILTVIGAATGEGKSIFKKHLQETAARDGLTCLDLSFEDPPERSADRTFSTMTAINNARLGMGDYTDRELLQIAIALEEAEEWAGRIDYHYGLRTAEDALRIVLDSGADLVQIDYAQAFPEGSKGMERTIADLAWALNEDAQEKKRSVIVYSQLTTKVETRGVDRAESSRRFSKDGDKGVDIAGFRPFGSSDLAWSSALGQRAKGLGFLFRPGRAKRRFKENVKDDTMELIWPKKNFGAEGTVVVGFDGPSARLFDLPSKEKA